MCSEANCSHVHSALSAICCPQHGCGCIIDGRTCGFSWSMNRFDKRKTGNNDAAVSTLLLAVCRLFSDRLLGPVFARRWHTNHFDLAADRNFRGVLLPMGMPILARSVCRRVCTKLCVWFAVIDGTCNCCRQYSSTAAGCLAAASNRFSSEPAALAGYWVAGCCSSRRNADLCQ